MTTLSEFQELLEYLDQRVVGQHNLVKRLVIALLSSGHLLVEGAPGLAKTTAIKTLSDCIDCSYHRIQFTPDLLPSDLTGTEIYYPETHEFVFQSGPLFNNLLLADEINRAPAKVQSALLEAMSENQITIAKKKHLLPKMFLVMATQNPIEHEGTYPLPEAQLDRFMLHVKIDYPNEASEKKILDLNRPNSTLSSQLKQMQKIQLTQELIVDAQTEINNIHISDALEQYLIQLILATRSIHKYDNNLAKWIRYGASPRGTIALDRASRAHAWLDGRDYVNPHDIHAVIHEVLRHRILLTFEAEVDNVTGDDVIDRLIRLVPIP